MDRKVYCIDPENSIVQKGLSVLTKPSRIAIDFLILHGIAFVFLIIIEAMILKNNFSGKVTLYIFLVCWAFWVCNLIFSAIQYSKYASGRYIPFVVTDPGTIKIFRVTRYLDKSPSAPYGFHKTSAKTDEDGYRTHSPIPFRSAPPLDNTILDQNLRGHYPSWYSFLTYEHVRFVTETAYHYHFVGDLVRIKGGVKHDQKFKIAKIYTDHETLKAVN